MTRTRPPCGTRIFARARKPLSETLVTTALNRDRTSPTLNSVFIPINRQTLSIRAAQLTLLCHRNDASLSRPSLLTPVPSGVNISFYLTKFLSSTIHVGLLSTVPTWRNHWTDRKQTHIDNVEPHLYYMIPAVCMVRHPRLTYRLARLSTLNIAVI